MPPIDASAYVPVDPVGKGWMKQRITIYKVGSDGVTLEPAVTNLRCYIDRPTGALRWGQIIISEDYTFRVFLAYKYRKPDNSYYEVSIEEVKEGSILDFQREGRTVRLVVRRRYNPSLLNRYIILECVEAEPFGAIEPLNP